MPTPPRKPPDRHYDFGRMNMVFAWSALALLAVTVWMVFDDYAKPWKRLQAEFRDRERQKLLAEAEAERQRLNENEIAHLEQQIDAEEARLGQEREEIRRLESQEAKLDKKVYAAEAAGRGTKSLLDTARYRLERAVVKGRSEEIEAARARVEELAVRLREQRKALETLSGERDAIRQDLATRRAGVVEAEGKLAELRQGVDLLERRVAKLDKSIDYFLLNAPMLDFVQPELHVEQVILPGLFQDINFTRVDRVDRCVTCHVAAGRAGFEGEEWEEPFRSHPRLDLFVGTASPHPYATFGCTTCHGGLDRATDFARAGHSPSTADEKQQWIERWGWEPQKYLENPILPGELSEAGCVGCHAAEVWTPGSQLQDVGRELVLRMGCFVCHKIDYPAFTDLPRPGPNLARVAGKTRPEWAAKWIAGPREFHPTTWMPDFFFLENIEGERNEKRQWAEIRAMVAYIWDHSERPEYPPPPPGDARRGEELFNTVGCTGCHLLDPDATRDQFLPQINRLHGPNLVRTGSKVDAGWLYAWLKNPRQYMPDTRMPSLRLKDQEAADLTSFLMSSRDPAFENLEMPLVDSDVRDELVLNYLQNRNTIEQSQALLAEMSDHERDVYLGSEVIQKYGCWGCHDLSGFELAKPIGVELTEEGSKPVHQFDFGHVEEVAHTRHDWIRTKLVRPRIWDRDKELVKNYEELYKMPDFGMSEREADAVLANVLGFTKESVVATRRAGQDARSRALVEGRKLINRYNCQGCHLIEGEGHAIATSIEDVGMLPPNLAAEGARVQADWLFDYLHDPGQVSLRPWLTVRMPTFGFKDEEVNRVVGYFAAREERQPFLSPPGSAGERERGVGRVVFNMLQCAKCHPAGPEAAAAVGARPAELAPSLLLARQRLRHDWVPSWIKDPQSWITGTRMPSSFPRLETGEYQSPLVSAIDAPMFTDQREEMMSYFGSEDELKSYLGDVDQVTRALRDHIWWGMRR